MHLCLFWVDNAFWAVPKSIVFIMKLLFGNNIFHSKIYIFCIISWDKLWIHNYIVELGFFIWLNFLKFMKINKMFRKKKWGCQWWYTGNCWVFCCLFHVSHGWRYRSCSTEFTQKNITVNHPAFVLKPKYTIGDLFITFSKSVDKHLDKHSKRA